MVNVMINKTRDFKFLEKTEKISKICECNRSLYTWGGMILYRISLEILYIFAISPLYSYQGFELDVYSIKYLFSWMVYIFLMAY